MIRFMIIILINAAIWIGLGKNGVEHMFPELMASEFASDIPLVMLFGGVLTTLIIVASLSVHYFADIVVIKK